MKNTPLADYLRTVTKQLSQKHLVESQSVSLASFNKQIQDALQEKIFLSSHDVADIFWLYEKFAAHNKAVSIHDKDLTLLLSQFLFKNLRSRDLSVLLESLGKLASYHAFQAIEKIPFSNFLLDAIRQFKKQKDNTAMAISSGLSGLGLCVKYQLIDSMTMHHIDKDLLFLLTELPQYPDMTPVSLSRSWAALGHCADFHLLTSQEPAMWSTLLKNHLNFFADCHDIKTLSLFFYGVGHLAKHGLFSPQNIAELPTFMSAGLSSITQLKNIFPENIAMLLTGIGYCARANLLPNQPMPTWYEPIENLLNKFLSSKPTLVELCSLLEALGLLAHHDILGFKSHHWIPNVILETLRQLNYHTPTVPMCFQAIQGIAYCLGHSLIPSSQLKETFSCATTFISVVSRENDFKKIPLAQLSSFILNVGYCHRFHAAEINRTSAEKVLLILFARENIRPADLLISGIGLIHLRLLNPTVWVQLLTRLKEIVHHTTHISAIDMRQYQQILDFCEHTVKLPLTEHINHYLIPSDFSLIRPLSSPFHRTVSWHIRNLLSQTDYSYQVTDEVPESGFFIDIVIQITGSALKLGIECDGHQYHLAHQHEKRHALLTQRGWTLIHISDTEWMAQKNRFHYLQQRLLPYFEKLSFSSENLSLFKKPKLVPDTEKQTTSSCYPPPIANTKAD